MKRFHAIPIVLILCPFLLAGCSKKQSDAGKSTAGAGKTEAAAAAADIVAITLEQQGKGGIQVAAVEMRSIPQSLTVTGRVVMDEEHTAHIGALADGIVEAVSVLPGDTVHAGQTLAHIHSHLIHETAAALAQAYAETQQKKSALKFAEQARARYAHLYGIQAASLEEDQRSNQQLVQAQTDLSIAESTVRREREHLSELVQVHPETLNADNIMKYEDVPARTPISGVVVSRNITPATVVQAGAEAFVVTNPATVWVTSAVGVKDIALVKIGNPVIIRVQGYDDQIFHGRVGQLGSTLDAATRTLPVRVVVPNPGQLLKPEMFASATIQEAGTRSGMFIPENALQEIKGVPTVFVLTDAQHFRAQSVSLGDHNDGRVEVLQGLKAGDKIVTSGAFMVKSELLKDSVGAQ